MRKIISLLLSATLLLGVAGAADAMAASKKKAKARTSATNSNKKSKCAVFKLKKNGTFTVSNFYLKAGKWAKDGKIIQLAFYDEGGGFCDGFAFYYNGGLYELGTECELNKKRMTVSCCGEPASSLKHFKQCEAKIEWE